MTDELAAAGLLPAADCLARTRELLARPEVAAEPRAWAQLAAAALRTGQLDDAADAAAEGLARAGDDEVLLELVRRARGELETPVRAHTWRADATYLAASGESLVIAGGSTVDLWSVDGTRGRVLELEHAITCLAADAARVVIGTAAGDLHVWDLRRDRVDVLETEPTQSEAQRDSANQAAWGFALGGGSIEQYPELAAQLAPGKLAVRAVAVEHATIAAANEVQLAMWPDGSYAGRFDARVHQLGLAGHEVITLREGLAVHPRDTFAGRPSVPTRQLSTPRVRALHVRGGVVYAGDADGVIWRFLGAHVDPPLRGHTAAITALASGDELVVSASEDGTLRWWRDGHAIAAAAARIAALAVTDAGIVATLDEDGAVTTWHCARALAPRVEPRIRVSPDAGAPFAAALGAHTMFGRHFECDVRLDDRRVSHRMFGIERAGDRYRLVDHQSLNGTWVNGVRVHRDRVLCDGDRIEVIGFRMVFER